MKKLIIALILGYSILGNATYIFPPKQVRCDKNGDCQEVELNCDGQIKDIHGLCRTCELSYEDTQEIEVKVESDCFCRNRTVEKIGTHIYCRSEGNKEWNKLKTKYGYMACGHCVANEDVLDCSECLDDFDIIDGKCYRKELRACFTE